MDIDTLRKETIPGINITKIIAEAQAIADANPAEYPGTRSIVRLVQKLVFKATGAEF